MGRRKGKSTSAAAARNAVPHRPVAPIAESQSSILSLDSMSGSDESPIDQEIIVERSTSLDGILKFIRNNFPREILEMFQQDGILMDLMHEAIYGPNQSNTKVLRVYKCCFCDFEDQVKPGSDCRKHNRQNHAISKHAVRIPAKVVKFVSERFAKYLGNPLAELMKLYEIEPSGDAGFDESLAVFIFCSKLNISFAAAGSEDFRMISRITKTINPSKISEAGLKNAQLYFAKLAKSLPNDFGILVDGWTSYSRHYLAVLTVHPVANGMVQYHLLGFLDLQPIDGNVLKLADELKASREASRKDQEASSQSQAQVPSYNFRTSGRSLSNQNVSNAADGNSAPISGSAISSTTGPRQSANSTDVSSLNAAQDLAIHGSEDSVMLCGNTEDIDAARAEIELRVPEVIEQDILSCFIMDGKKYESTIREMLARVGKTSQNVLFLVGDNCPLNKKLSELLRVTFIGCAAHTLNLALKSHFASHKTIIGKVYKVLKLATNSSKHKRFLEVTAAVPTLASFIRWRSLFDMLECYLEVENNLPYGSNRKLYDAKLTTSENDVVRQLADEYRRRIPRAYAELDRAHVPIGDARLVLDMVLREPLFRQTMAKYLPRDCGFLPPNSQDLINAAGKIVAGTVDLTESETSALDLVMPSQSPSFEMAPLGSDDAFVPTLGKVQIAWIPATTSAIERLFSRLKHILTPWRTSVKDVTLEAQVIAMAQFGGISLNQIIDPVRERDQQLIEALKNL